MLRKLNSMADRSRVSGMQRYGINTQKALGISVTELRGLARALGRDHDLATALWDSEIHEARLLATMIDEPAQVTEAQMEAWVYDLDSWDVCDQLCGNLFDRTRFAFRKAVEWSARDDEFVKRAGFALMAWSAVHRKDAADEQFEVFLPLIRSEATDDHIHNCPQQPLRQNREKIADGAVAAVGTRAAQEVVEEPAPRADGENRVDHTLAQPQLQPL